MSTENKTKQEIASELLTKYSAADSEVTRVKALLDEANKRRSDVVKELHDNLGKGPFTFKGDYLGKIVVRGNTYFFRGKSDDGVIKVE
jgi:hypothetical protein